jgi:ATP-binding cassette subfamily A (ABC1) protein 3
MFCTYRILKVLASLLSPTAFALGSINFADYERAHVGLRWSNIWRVYSVFGALPLLLIILEAFLCASKLFRQYWCRSHLG